MNPSLRTWILFSFVTVLGALALQPASAADGVAGADPPDPCLYDEGKDLLCHHFKTTMARLMAPESMLLNAGSEDTDITHCFLDVELDYTAHTIAGTNTITAASRTDNLTTFTLDLYNNMIVDGVTVNSVATTFTRPGNQIAVNLDRAYNTGETFTVAVTYHGSPMNAGFSSFTWTTHNGATLAASLSEPWYAYTWWPCKESLNDKFTSDMWVTVPAGNVVASNGVLQGTDALSGGRLRYRWHESYPIATYLVALAATNYAKWTEYYNYAGGSMPVEFYSYPETLASMQAGVADVVTEIQTFSRPDVYGQYPFLNEKYGICQFAWGGGMENQTITSQYVFATWINSHELSHQWWGDMVTCGTWHDIWLNEGFASFSEAYYLEKMPGGSHAAYLNQMQQRRPSTNSGTVYVYNATDLNAVFSTTNVYNKGAWAVHMLRHVLGDEAFVDLLSNYRAAFAGGNATTSDLQVVAEGVYGGDLAWFFNEWVYGPGAPNYRYGWQSRQVGSEYKLLLDVEQYQTAYSNFRMPIDITVTTNSGSQTRTIWQQDDIEWYSLPADGPVTAVQFDKDTWILSGDRANTSFKPPLQLVGTTPRIGAPGMNVTTIDIQFSQPVTYNASDFTVTGSTSGPVSFTTSYLSADKKVRLSFSNRLPVGETWTVSVSDNVLWQLNGSRLDGEIADPGNPASLPSGNGLPGGSAVFSFITSPPGDFDADGDVDQEDFGHLQACRLGWGVPQTDPSCQDADLNHDGYVDSADADAFYSCDSGPRVAPDPLCGG